MSYLTGIELSGKRKRKPKLIKDVINRVYLVKAMGGCGYIVVPNCFLGKKVKLLLMEDKK